MKRVIFYLFIFIFAGCSSADKADVENNIITMSTTTSTENSGLLDVLLPEFKKDTGIEVKVIAKGTGAAIKDGIDGNVDVIFVHALEQEEKFVSDEYGAYRLSVMYNDFIIIGPESDPAGITGMKDSAAALKRIAESRSYFVSRGDDSGTHIKEQQLWEQAGVTLQTKNTTIVANGKKSVLSFKSPEGLDEYYFSIGQGMGKALTYAEEKQAYTLTDRGTYLKYKYGRDQGLDLIIMVEGDPGLFNPYGVIPVNPKKHPHVKFDQAERFAKWLVSEKAQRLIAGYKIEGHQAFFPDKLIINVQSPTSSIER